MNGLLVVAASGLAREALGVATLAGGYDDIRVLDDDPGLWGATLGGHPVVGGIDHARRYKRHQVLVCTGSGAVRRSLVARLADLGVAQDRYATVVHPSASIGTGCRVDAGSVVLAGVVMTADVEVGRHVVVMPHVTLTHDDVVDDFVTLCAGVTLGGGVRVRSGAYLGMSASVRHGVRVGRDAVLGMGAALVRDLPDDETWVGVPARPADEREEAHR